jgi:imidazolonepropionase
LHDRGALVPGARADFLVLSSRDWRDLPYTLGGQIIERLYIGGV